MNKVAHLALCMIVSSTVLLPAPVWAADEEVSVPVYLTFDPVTGKLSEAPAKPQTTHIPAESSVATPDTQVDQQAIVDAQPAEAGISSAEQAGGAASTGPNRLIVWGGIGIVLVVGIGLFARKYQQKPGL